ncbi:MAG TPA: hypothetical protein VGF40_08950 [Thermoanaerobaculia bacterium]
MRCAPLILILAVATGCASAPSNTSPPWTTNAQIPRGSAPPVLLEEWARADNRASCAPLTFDPAVVPRDATPRRANFSGGWAVAWDQPGQPGRDASGAECARCGRGVFGIAGTGAEASDEDLAQWEHQQRWPDGSWAGWGPEGHQGPRWLAYVRVAGEGCLYNVWSSISRDHLESLIASLRSVEPLP